LPQIDTILNVLQDGKWHDLKKISDETQLQEFKVEIVTNFLAEYDFIELNKKENKTRLTPPLFNFLKKVREIEENEG